MNSPDNREPLAEIAHLLGHVRRKGVKLWSENGELRYRAPKGVLTREDLEKLRASGGKLAAFLGGSAGAHTEPPTLEPRRQFARAPLTFTQLAYWHLNRLYERRSVRHLASAMRLCGRFDVDLLRRTLSQIIERHEALRTRIVVADGIPMQQIAASGALELSIDDLSASPESAREVELRRLIDQLILEPIDLAVGPLLGMRLVRLRHDEHVLIVAMDHMISDAFSLNILLRDLLTSYVQASEGRAVSLPPISMQFADYAVWQENAHESWVATHGAYWTERLKGCQRLRFPDGNAPPTANRPGWSAIPLQIDRELKAELREWCRLRRTTLVMSVFTAFVALVLRWCSASEAVIRYQTDGRANPEVANTIGYFASVLHLRIALRDADRFVDLLNRVTHEYCNAYAHADFSYIDAQLPQPDFARNSAFNWVSQEPKSDLLEWGGSEGAIVARPIPFTNPVHRNYEKDSEPVVLLYDTDDGIVGGVHFPLSRFPVPAMEAFARSFLVFITTMLREPHARVNDVRLR